MAKKIVILGGKESGTGAAILAKKEGYNVFVSDYGKIEASYISLLNKHEIAWEEGQHTEKTILEADEILISPGIPEKAPIVQKCIAAGKSIVSEIEFASRYTEAFIIAITGSNGKTTTTSLTYQILKDAGLQVGLAGNIGKSFAMQVATASYDYYVLEVSSFQLDRIETFCPDIAVLLNITPDHLDRYNYSYENYIQSKFRIAENQSRQEYLIYCQDDEAISDYMKKHPVSSTCIPFSTEHVVKEGGYAIHNQFIINVKKKS